MHMRAKNIISVAVAGIACASAYGFKTNYVDCTLADYTGHDGTSWTKAFKTIQEGVEAAVAGDLPACRSAIPPPPARRPCFQAPGITVCS